MTLAEATRQYQRALEAYRSLDGAYDQDVEDELKRAREHMEGLWVIHEAERFTK